MADDKQELDLTVQKLTEWKNEPSIRDLKQDLEDARSSHLDQVQKIDEWMDSRNITGKAKVDTPKGKSKIVPKLIRRQAEWRYPSLTEPFLSTEDLFNVSPVTWEDKEGAIQNQLVLNNQFNTKLDKVNFIDEYVRTAVDEGTVIVRLGWKFEEQEYEEDVPVAEFRINPALGPLHERLAAMRQQDPQRYAREVQPELQQAHELTLQNGQPIEAVITGYETQSRTRVLKNQPTVEVCDYRNIIIDPTCNGNLDEARFIIYSFESSLSELRKDKKYKNLDNINLEANSILGEPDHAVGSEASKTFNFSDKPRKKFVVYEYWGYWDIDGSGFVKPIVAAWVGQTMIRMEDNPYPDQKLPFVSVHYLPVRRSTHGEPDGALIEDNQKIAGAVTRGMIDTMARSANGQMGVRKDALDLTNRRKFEKGQDYEYNGNVDPRLAFHMHTYPEIPRSAMEMLQLQNMEAEALTGVKSFSQGLGSQALGDVAAGIRGALDAASKRELSILRRLSDGIIKIGRKIIAMNAEFLSEEEVVRITEDEFVTVRRDDLPGNYDLKLSISTAEEDNNKAEQLAFMLQTMGNNMDPAMARMILADIARLRKMPDLAKRLEEYQPQPDPIAQRIQQLELAKLEAEVAKLQADTQKQTTAAQLDTAKVGTEQAKAENLLSDTDQKNLDFVEQESGVKQERELQKQGEQARAQARMKVLEHGLKQREPKASKKN